MNNLDKIIDSCLVELTEKQQKETVAGGFWKDVGEALHHMLCTEHGYYRDRLDAHPGNIAL